MDLRTRTTLLCGALALAIAASMLLRGRTKAVHWLFAGFAVDIALWYLAEALYGLFQATIWARFTALLAVFLPQFALHLFEAIVPHEKGTKSLLLRVAGALAVPMVLLVLSPQHWAGLVRGAIFLYVFGLVAAGLFSLARRGQKSRSRETNRRVRFLVVVGALAASFSLADFLWFIGADPPPVGAVLSIVFLFVLSESLRRERLLDGYELLGRLVVSTALAFVLAGIFYVFVTYIGRFNTMYLNAVLAAIAILVLFEPLRSEVERRIHRIFFRERRDLENAVSEARSKLTHVLELDELRRVVSAALEQSRRATSAGLYLSDLSGTGLDLAAGIGTALPSRVELATVQGLWERAAKGAIVLEEVVRDVAEKKAAGDAGEAALGEAVLAAATVLGPLAQGIVLGIRAEKGDLVGLLVMADDRVRDAYSPDEVALLESLAAQIGVVIENSFVYRRMQEKDRLATIGQMAARLAHEVKNPLGAIKGAAQLLAEPSPGASELDAASREFLGIILEEVDRLDRVVGSVLDYARPSKGHPSPIDLNGIVKRTVQIFFSQRDAELSIDLELASDLPRVRADAEQLRQVLMNLMRNAVQAASGPAKIAVETRVRRSPPSRASMPSVPASAEPQWVELRVKDSGSGISQKVLKNLFVPFFTTKNQGTGLGLAISQRIVKDVGGTIEVSSHEGAGTTFTVVLPVFEDPLSSPLPGPVAAAVADASGSPELARLRSSLLGESQIRLVHGSVT